MIHTSTAYQKAQEKERRFIAKASCILKNGVSLNFDKSNLTADGVKISDGVSGTSSFDIGAAIVNKLVLKIYNGGDEFSEYDFTDAVITVWVGQQLTDGVEWLKKGVFNASDPTTTPDVITLDALDNMKKFDTAYDGKLTFPNSLQAIVQYCCSKCGVLLANGQFPNYDYRVSSYPFDEKSNITYRVIIAYCAQIAGCYARCNVDGRLELKWYDTAAFDNIIDGGVFDETAATKYQTGDTLDGGNFTDYTSGDSADGGIFTENLPYHPIYKFSSLSVSTEEVVITGIRVTASDSEKEDGGKIEGETYLSGADGYVLDMSGNPLIEVGRAKEVAQYLAGRVVGMKFRPFSASCLGDPSMEAGDAAILVDRKGNGYHTYLTSISYSTGGYANISCDAEPAARHSADRYSEINKIIADLKKDSRQKLSEYGKYVDQMNSLAINAVGYYETDEKQSDGSFINYMHDKPLLTESTIVYKKTIDGFFISRDGGKTYIAGMDKDANIVANVLAVIGIRADWIDADSITAKQLSVQYKDSVTSEINTKFHVAEEVISAEISRAKDAEKILENSIKINTDGIKLKVSKGDISSQISQEAGLISLKSNRLSISSTNFTLTASGYVTMKGASCQGTFEAKNGDWFIKMAYGAIQGGYGSTTYGNIDFAGAYNNDSARTLRIRGNPGIDLMSGRIYVGTSYNAGTVYQAFTGTRRFITDIADLGGGSIQWTWTDFSFKNGIMM